LRQTAFAFIKVGLNVEAAHNPCVRGLGRWRELL